MAIIGIKSLLYGVDDLDTSTRYFEDFGLQLSERRTTFSRFRLEEGSEVVLRHISDPLIPESSLVDIGVREVVWGVDDEDDLAALLTDLKRDREVRIDEHGVAHFLGDCGLPFALALFRRRPIVTAPDPVNSPGRFNRLNQTRKWRLRAKPKNIQHVVFGINDHEAAFLFLRDRLRFRLSDVMRGCGIFARAEGNNEHHQIFLVEAKTTLEGLDGKNRFHHANFGVEDIDELMIGVNTMERRGWPKSSVGLGRHRLSSGLFCYMPCPAGGQAEYGTDFDALDDNWIPRIYEIKFSYSTWLTNMPAFMMDEPAWEWCYAPGYLPVSATIDVGELPKE
ncbi:hypothetical protein ALQ33_01562 [Pseudomonas syringae pv. philadelphi]|uniref:Glyoxalase n=1 Tax=Pseudomonas syringae pv. philadelphi TaxID=251706 RepID=A0A3M3YKZ8_9PSED|nr:VOC family protein [Pseudomonas syringae group genomosp. 3]RMO82906.1 hypothetical protein ALQ33_01562 [Pseudomonas syringae pv. philadelphi]